ncbi:MAG: hypothetical protein AAGI12_15770 [Pseudomonadota bacterium]
MMEFGRLGRVKKMAKASDMADLVGLFQNYGRARMVLRVGLILLAERGMVWSIYRWVQCRLRYKFWGSKSIVFFWFFYRLLLSQAVKLAINLWHPIHFDTMPRSALPKKLFSGRF